jgi:hypothetical protein
VLNAVYDFAVNLLIPFVLVVFNGRSGYLFKCLKAVFNKWAIVHISKIPAPIPVPGDALLTPISTALITREALNYSSFLRKQEP